MGRPKLKMDETAILKMRFTGRTIKDISRDLGVSTATLSRRIAELKNEKGLLTKYRELQGLQLTGLQFRVLESITPERIKESSLPDLVRAFYVLNKAEGAIKGKDSFKINGLVDHLLEIERERVGGPFVRTCPFWALIFFKSSQKFIKFFIKERELR
jgi:DNA-binding Lrp family transcriptional regulator